MNVEKMQTLYKIYFLFSSVLFSLFPGQVTAQNAVEHTLKLNKDGIKVYVHRHKNSGFRAFKAITCIDASLDSILAVMLDNDAYTEWVYACNKSFVLKELSFYERYHYQVLDIPFPFKDRDFVLHSLMQHNPSTQTVSITSSAVLDYCLSHPSAACNQVQQTQHVRVSLSVGTFKLEPCKKGVQVTWSQHTDPAGKLPDWLVNQFVEDTPYWTLKNLSQKVKEEKYKYAKLIYDKQGYAIAFDAASQKAAVKASRKAKDFDLYPSF